jgi:glyoxylase-like metal-dependent hydrolase (beta-lactamase superfamily II)
MDNLFKVGEKTYYYKARTNIGLYLGDNNNVWVIDSGIDDDTGKKIIHIAEENGWNIKGVLNTHSHADHMGGDYLISKRTNAIIASSSLENCFIKYPFLEPSLLYGGNPIPIMHNKLIEAMGINDVKDINDVIPDGLEVINLEGHSLGQIGLKTSDNVYFIGDSLIDENTINKYKIFYLTDIRQYLNSLDKLNKLEGKLFVPSHGPVLEDIHDLVKINNKGIEDIENYLMEILKQEKSFEMIMDNFWQDYNLPKMEMQYILDGSIIKNYLTYLYNEEKITYVFKNNNIYWSKK